MRTFSIILALAALSLSVTALIATRRSRRVTGETSDGYHTFNELYRHRLLLNAVLFNLWALLAQTGGEVFSVRRSKAHHPDDTPIYDGYFIVTAELPAGQISYHYPLKDWDLFHTVIEIPYADKWDGHTSDDVCDRLQELIERDREFAGLAGKGVLLLPKGSHVKQAPLADDDEFVRRIADAVSRPIDPRMTPPVKIVDDPATYDPRQDQS